MQHGHWIWRVRSRPRRRWTSGGEERHSQPPQVHDGRRRGRDARPPRQAASHGDGSARGWYHEHPDWFTQPHHDYPAIDIAVPVGTRVYAVTNGVVVGTPNDGKRGIGVVFNGDDGAQYTYCHGGPGTQVVAIGYRITADQYLMDSASTGNSTGPHLHFNVEAEGAYRCPQTFLVSIADGKPLAPDGLPTAGCTS